MTKEMNALRIVENTRASQVEGVIDIDTDDEGEVELPKVESVEPDDGVKSEGDKPDEKAEGELGEIDLELTSVNSKPKAI